MNYDTLLVEPQALADDLDQPNLRIFDTAVTLEPQAKGYRAVSGLADYQAAHIPGAAFMDLITALSDTTTGLGFTLPSVTDLAAGLGQLGIGNDTDVVLYSSGHMMWATRAFWLLRLLGHDRTRVLNGGLGTWTALGLPTRPGDEAYPPQHFDASPREGVFADLERMQSIVESGDRCVVNALSQPMYEGSASFDYGRPGHIPGSVNVPFDQLLDANAFPAADALHERLDAAQLATSESVVTYCGGGIAATIPAFARLLAGYGDTAVYDGSMSEWVRADLPLRTGNEP